MLDVVGNLERAAGSSLDPFRDALGRGTLLLDRGGNRGRDPADALTDTVGVCRAPNCRDPAAVRDMPFMPVPAP